MRRQQDLTPIHLTTGKVVKMLRELNGLTQVQLATRSGISQPSLSAIENDLIAVGLVRAQRLAKALHAHPATIAFPNMTPEQWRAEIAGLRRASSPASLGAVSGRTRVTRG